MPELENMLVWFLAHVYMAARHTLTHHVALFKRMQVGSIENDDLFVAEAVQGECRVICFHPRHDLTVCSSTCARLRSGFCVFCARGRMRAWCGCLCLRASFNLGARESS